MGYKTKSKQTKSKTKQTHRYRQQNGGYQRGGGGGRSKRVKGGQRQSDQRSPDHYSPKLSSTALLWDGSQAAVATIRFGLTFH